MGAANAAEQGDWTVTLLSHLWVRDYTIADIMWKSPRVEAYQEGEADEARQLELDSVEETRINALTQSARYL